jgi:hypothetical protein|tara:strand:+ start:620 stop:724 length:105 start_codon:yes stop_codon:yes gene_type:complete
MDGNCRKIPAKKDLVLETPFQGRISKIGDNYIKD